MTYTLITLLLLAYTIYNVIKLEHKVNELRDEVHALHHALDIETEFLKNKLGYLETQHGKTV
jgi:hypothetical protein